MKSVPSLILAVSCAALPLTIQADGQIITQSTTPHPAQARRVMPPPASTLPPPAARMSTAQAGAARNAHPPLQLLPDFSVTDRDGHPRAASTLGAPSLTTSTLTVPAKQAAALSIKSTNPILKSTGSEDHWLLLYRAQDCIPCDRLMNALSATTSPDFKRGAPYVILVAAKNVTGLESVRASFTTLTDATWLADSNKLAYAALKPHGTPMLYAMDGNRIAWSVPGSLDNSTHVKEMADSWIANSGIKASSTSVPTAR